MNKEEVKQGVKETAEDVKRGAAFRGKPPRQKPPAVRFPPPPVLPSKRVFDVAVAGFALVLLSPLLLFLSFAVKVTSRGPVFFTGERVGRGGRRFRMIKFRTMVGNADRIGPTVTAEDDPRITAIGRFLRRTKLDELPTLINVLRGDMSIVGPRPETAPWIPLYTLEERRILLVLPGITSLATILYRHEEKLLAGKKIEEAYPPIMREKLRIELDYLRNRSFLTDLKIIALTINAIFQKHVPERQSLRFAYRPQPERSVSSRRQAVIERSRG